MKLIDYCIDDFVGVHNIELAIENAELIFYRR